MRSAISIILAIIPLLLFSQSDADRYHRQQQQENRFEKSKKFKGPEDWNSSYPSDMSGNYYSDEQGKVIDSPVKAVVADEDLKSSREERYGSGYGEGAVDRPNPEILPPNPVEFPDITLPEIDLPDLPDINLPDFDMPYIGTWEFWKIVLLILVIGILIFALYLILRKIRPSDSKVTLNVEDEWNPTVVTKSELELKLEKAILGNNYRECVRIHFMFILKELIAKNYIDWKPEKTNYDYLVEVRTSKGYDKFDECVRIYDLVWYGDYEITQKDYERLKPSLENYYQSLNPEA